MKGISAMIAVVLLIAFTVAVGGLISVWFTTFTRTTTSGVEAATTNQTRCAGAYIKVDSVKSLGDYVGIDNTNTTVIYSNPSPHTISSISIISNGGESFVGTTTSLEPSGIGKSYLNLSSGTSVILKGLCLASVPVEGSCKVGEVCWQI
ncbi:MAG: archaellin/type IV pilin N-terminal domain-containing protein [Candidatus Aenigmatarchaeota archaeon]